MTGQGQVADWREQHGGNHHEEDDDTETKLAVVLGMQYIKNYYYQPQKSETSKVIFLEMVGGRSMKTDLTMALDTNYHLQTTK